MDAFSRVGSTASGVGRPTIVKLSKRVGNDDVVAVKQRTAAVRRASHPTDVAPQPIVGFRLMCVLLLFVRPWRHLGGRDFGLLPCRYRDVTGFWSNPLRDESRGGALAVGRFARCCDRVGRGVQ